MQSEKFDSYNLGFSRVASLIRLACSQLLRKLASYFVFIVSKVILHKNATRARPPAIPCNNSEETEEVKNIMNEKFMENN